MHNRKGRYLIVLIFAFVLIVGAGRVIGGQLITKSNNAGEAASKTEAPAASNTRQVQSSQAVTTSTPADESVSGCIASLEAEVNDKKIQYEKGTILVSFQKSVDFDAAVNTLATYGATVQATADTKDSFTASHLLTAHVPAGEEYSKICIAKRNASGTFAGLNTLFSLHD
jgi:hypothetical protein